MRLALFLSLFLSYLSTNNIPQDILTKINKEESTPQTKTSVYTKDYIDISRFPDTLLSPIESLFLKITRKKYLKQIGYENLVNRGESPNIEFYPTSNYKFKTQDEIIVYLTGTMESSYSVVVDKTGMVFIPGIGTVKAAGQTLKSLEQKLNLLAKSKWTNVKVSVSPGRIRGIRVYLTGEVKNPGIYALKSHTTLLDLLFAGGGILKTGSLRDIQITHIDGTISHIDIYPYIFGGKTHSTELREGDIVIVKTLTNPIAVDGCVHKPGIYEIKKNTTLKTILNWAGVLPYSQNRAEIHRIKRDSIVIFSIPSSQWKKITLNPGDYVFIPFSKYNTGGYVFIKGNIKKSGYYTYTPNLTLSTLIQTAGGFLQPPYKDILVFRKDTLLTRIIEVNLKDTGHFELLEGDSVLIFQSDITKKNPPVIINGYVKKPGLMEWSKDLTVKKAILIAIPRYDADLDHITVYSRVRGTLLNFSRKTWNSHKLYPGDIIYIPQDTLQHQQIQVFIRGEVKYPGVYTLKKGSTLKDVLQLAGGLNENANKDGIFIKRTIISHKKKLSLTNTTLYNLLSTDSSCVLPENIKDIIEKRLENSIPGDMDLILADDDTIFVPQFTPYIYITGAVLKPYILPYEDGLNINKILKKAPLHPQADKNKAFAISPNGEIHRDRVKSGDILFVPFRKGQEKDILKNLALLTTLMYQIAMTIFVIQQVSK